MKKNCSLSIILLGLLAHPAFCQERCDTIILKDGRRIAAEIIRTNREGVLYAPCGSEAEREYLISQDKIVRIQRGHEILPKLNLPPVPKDKPLLTESSYLRKYTDLNKPKTISSYLRKYTDLSKPKIIIWVGIPFTNTVLSDHNFTRNALVRFGVEMGFKNLPLRLGIALRPTSWASEMDRYHNFKNDGLGGEIGLVLKVFALGRLTGHLSNVYGGLDVLTGRQASTYIYTYRPTVTSKITYTWITIMPRVGCQVTYKMFALDLALPIGYQRYHYTRRGDSYSDDLSSDLTIQPSVSLGFRF